MLNIENETCKIAMSYEIINFRNIVIKPYFRNETEENAKNVTNENIDRENEISINENSEIFFQINANFERIFNFFSQTHFQHVIVVDRENYF